MSTNDPSGKILRPHVLCDLCRSFWQNVKCLRFTAEQLNRGDEHVPYMPEHVIHAQSRSDVKVSAELGCHFCSIIMGSLTGCTGDHTHSKGDHTHSKGDNKEPIYISIAILDSAAGTFLLTLFACEQTKILSHDQILNTFQLRLVPTHGEKPSREDFQSWSISDHNEKMLSPLESRSSRWQNYTYSPSSAEFVQSWLHDCQKGHVWCSNDIIKQMQGLNLRRVRPRRLLDLLAFQNPEMIQLIDSEDDKSFEYCALSYSWGFSTPFVMTSSNLADFKRGIYVRDLPKLLRDAVQIVRGIGFRYLWIDALCIMQDGLSSSKASDDWLDQAGKMDNIFGNSVITIAAAEAFDGNSSMIMPRNPLSQTTCRLNVDTDLQYKIVPPCTPSCLLHQFNDARYHLDTRAWVFQERMLSPRTLLITRNFIHLECRTELRCEATSTPEGCHHSGAIPKSDYSTLFCTFGPAGLNDVNDSAVDLFFGYWHKLVQKYSNTNLSRPTDLLVAMAGLGKKIQRQSQLTWSFGLWREHLLLDMLWYVRGGKGVPQRGRAPTWSWASIEVRGPQIMYEACISVELAAEIITLPQISDFARQPPLLVEQSNYCVKVAGRFRSSIYWSKTTTTKEDPNRCVHRNCRGMPDIHPECPFHPDYELPESIELHILLIGRAWGVLGSTTSNKMMSTEVGLVLTPVTGYSDRYKRVGYFHHDMFGKTESAVDSQPHSLFQKSKMREIEIM